MLQYRTDLAMEAHELLCARSRAQTLSGVDSRTVFRRGCSVTSVRIDTEGAARQLGKPRGRYVRSHCATPAAIPRTPFPPPSASSAAR